MKNKNVWRMWFKHEIKGDLSSVDFPNGSWTKSSSVSLKEWMEST